MLRQICTGMLAAVVAIASVPADRSLADSAIGEPESDQPRVDRPRGRVEKATEPPLELGEFWLGLECYPVPPPLADQLGLAEQGGLVVEQVVPESPAERAGLKRHDVIVRAGSKPTAHIPELIAAVNETGEGELELEIIRGGKRQEVLARPELRPHEDQPRMWRDPPKGEDLDRLWQWFGRMGSDEEWRRPLRLHFFHPGAILPRGTELTPPLPENMSIVIRKKGAESTSITVNHGDESWELTDHDLDTLPDDVRPHVERMLGRGPVGFRVLPRRPGEPAGFGPPEGIDDASGEVDQMEQHMQRQIDEMGTRLDELRRSLDRWSGHRAPPRPRGPQRPDMDGPGSN